jgi:hypothetical protein
MEQPLYLCHLTKRQVELVDELLNAAAVKRVDVHEFADLCDIFTQARAATKEPPPTVPAPPAVPAEIASPQVPDEDISPGGSA